MEKPKIEPRVGGNYSGRDLSGQDLSGRDLRGCDFTRANLLRADLSGCSIDGAIFIEADLRETTWHAPTTSPARGGVANFARANLAGASIHASDFDRSFFAEAKLDGAEIRHAILRGADFFGASLIGADLSYSKLDSALFRGADLREAKFADAYIRGTEISGARFDRAYFARAKIAGVHFAPTQILGATFVPAVEIPATDGPIKIAKAINKITAYRAYQVLLETLWVSRNTNATHPEGHFDHTYDWRPSARENVGGSGVSTKPPGREDASKLNFYVRCRSKVHCRNLILAALDGIDVPADVVAVIDNAVEIFQTKIRASKDLARGLVMALKNENMRKALEI